MKKEKFNVTGMSCAACSAHVEKAVQKLNGIKHAEVNLLKNTLTAEWDENVLSLEEIVSAVENAGYGIILPDSSGGNKKVLPKEKNHDLAKLISCISILLVHMYFSMGHMMWNWPVPPVFDIHKNPIGFAFLQLVLTVPVLYIYRKYFISGFKKLFTHSSNMDTLIAIGATASILYGLFAMFMMSYADHSLLHAADLGLTAEKIEYFENVMKHYPHNLYFESASMILTLVSLGKYLEGLSKRKTTSAVEALINLAPKQATVLVDGKEVVKNAEDIKVGDIIIVKKGEAIAVDGVVFDGTASIDQSNITGESMPVLKKKGDEVFSSTILTAGYIKVEATKVGEDTSIANIIRLVDEASNSKAPISRLADKIAGIFVPVVLSISLVTLIINLICGTSFENALNFAITVVVIACPCALGLATPVAIMVGTGKGAQQGLLIKNAEILEKAHNIKIVALDKTGTITEGKPKVTDFICFNKEKQNEIISAVYSIENKCEHPLASALCEYAKDKATTLNVENYTSVDGVGVTAVVNGNSYSIGNKKAHTKELDEKVQKEMDRLAKEGKTPLVVSVNGVIEALIAVKDVVKESSKMAVSELKKMGIKVVMLTGDNEKTAKVIADEVGIDEVIADVHPDKKQEVVTKLKNEHKEMVAMVGDGVNDAPALTSADLGIAIGGGSDIAMQSSDIVLLKKDLFGIVDVIRLSKRVLNTIKLCLFWAFFYNSVCIVLATGLFRIFIPNFMINPMIGSAAMSISSVSVVLTALTINFFKSKKPLEDCNGACPVNIGNGNNDLIPDISGENNNNEVNNMKEITLKVKGMMCMHCVNHVEKAVKSVQGVTDVKVDLDNGTATFKYENEAQVEEAMNNIKAADYKVSR